MYNTTRLNMNDNNSDAGEGAPQNKNDRKYYVFAAKIVGDFGVSLFAPAVILSLLGNYADEKWNKRPLFLILGLVLAALVSARIIYRKAKNYGEEYQKLK